MAVYDTGDIFCEDFLGGGECFTVSQTFGKYNAALAGWYQYAASYGWPAGTHIGYDIAAPLGTEVRAIQGGTVIQEGFSDSFRPHPVWIEEDDGDVVIYGHLRAEQVEAGERVRAGQVIGETGEQTIAGTMIPDRSGPHLHLEVRRGGKAIDPAEAIAGSGPLPDGGGGFDLGSFNAGDVMTRSAAALIGVLVAGVGLVAIIGPARLAGFVKG